MRAVHRQLIRDQEVVLPDTDPNEVIVARLAALGSLELLSEWQIFVDALPEPVAVIGLNGTDLQEAGHNRAYACLRLDSIVAHREIQPDDVVAEPTLPTRVRDFLLGDEPFKSLWMQEGNGICGRHFIVSMTRLAPSVSFERRCVLSLLDRTAQVETERSLRSELLRDSLTGLPNRAAFGELVDDAIEQFETDGRHFAILVIDLTRFSRVNEGVGSLAGDELIITVARRLISSLRPGDALARLGGDEFAILLWHNQEDDEALNAARRIRASLATPIRLSDLEIKVDCAVGCALMQAGIDNTEDMLRNAQFAMKRAKISGAVEFYEPADSSAARLRFSLETELRRAIERDQLTLCFQPLISLTEGTVSGFEALARWNHPERGPISPNEFIPVAEESGLIVPLGRWAMRSALKTLAEWDRRAMKSLKTYVTVNVSAVQFQRDDVVMAVSAALAESGLTGERIKLELTESCIVGDPDRITTVLQALHALGIGMALDDFGTGYSSLAYLQRLPIEMLKIDRSFVAPMLHDRDSVAIVRAILSLADALGMTTTAEGVESAEQAETLTALGCQTAQGFYFARPLVPEDAYAFLKARNV